MRELQKKHYREVLKDNINNRCSSSAKIKEKKKRKRSFIPPGFYPVTPGQ